jgi:choline-sulfatase
VGRLVDHIDLANTLVVFVSDHGDYLGKRGQMWKAPTIPFEALARIPFFAFGAGVPPGTRYADPVSLVDLAPTFLLAAGSPIPDDLDGRPLQTCFRDPSSSSDRPVYCFGGAGFATVQRHGVKYFRSHDGAEEMLFDLTSDPGELHNLAAQPAWRDHLVALRREMDVVLSRPPAQLPRFPVPHDGSADDA